MKKLLAVIMLLLTSHAHAQENSPEVDRGIASVKQRTLDFKAEARDFNASSELILKYKNVSIDWIRAEDSENFFKLKQDREIFSMMGTGLEWNVALNAFDARNKFYVLPSVGLNLYMRIRPRLDVYAQFTGLPLGNRGRVSDFESGLRYFPQKNLSISAGWRRIDFRLRRGEGIGAFERCGLFAGVRYDF